jgi:NADPH:quinone reductase
MASRKSSFSSKICFALAVQIAKAAGARILATASSDNQEILKELGADMAIDYKSQDVKEFALDDTGGEGVDAVLDTVGGGTIVESLPLTKHFGCLATTLGTQGDLTALYQKNQTLYGVFLNRERARVEKLSTLIERGQVRPLVAEVLPLEEVGKAHERLDSGHGRGKVVLRVTEE